MKDNNNKQQICLMIAEISLYLKDLLSAKKYEDNICYVFGFLSDVEHILVEIGNMRFDSLLTESQIDLEEQVFDEWMALYNIAKAILTKRNYSDKYKKEINEHAESTFAKLKEFEKGI